ncbi:MAG: hypothetical protein H6597_06390 [Flavobacteriales bacterium]|nr:hypothetical protein [Flavobacteriales bacterium]MCB9194144.1 hypothetical protein [Flavobacteriales bacterium]
MNEPTVHRTIHRAVLLAIPALVFACAHEPVIGPQSPDTASLPDPLPFDTGAVASCDPDTVYFEQQVFPLITAYCTGVGDGEAGCHNAARHAGGVDLHDHAHIHAYVQPGFPTASDLYGVCASGWMPVGYYALLDSAQLQSIATWIAQGALDNSCPEACDTVEVTYSGDLAPLLESHCLGCHQGAPPPSGVSLDSWSACSAAALNGTLAGDVFNMDGHNAMPPAGPALTACQKDEILTWIQHGAPDN